MTNKETEKAAKTVSAQLWDKIKNIPLDIFALPNQTIKDHAKREESMEAVFPNDVYLILKSAAVYPALEEALGTAIARGQIKLSSNERLDLSRTAQFTVIKTVPKM